MERGERFDASSPTTPDERLHGTGREKLSPMEQILVGFTYAEQQRLRYLRQLYERGKLTEFPRHTRD